MALFGSSRGSEWWNEVSDAETEVDLCASELEKMQELLRDAKKQNVTEDFIAKLESHVKRAEKNFLVAKKNLEQIRNSYHE